ncbi:MAG: single-stranded DNA-binding protein [Candidatus Omnitrophota bacterium]|jgi:single-strand DNA-binding protein|nr:MAG: single-stranded DNA-binding protein [Candidatus Omnitrophota bacterium]
MLNHIVLIGRLVADPDVRYTQSGIQVAKICLAVDRKFKNAAGERETDFINVVAWRKLAELLEKYMKKGRLIAVQGSLQSRKYQTKEGENRTAYEVQADEIKFLDWGDRPGSGGISSPPPHTDADVPPSSSPSSYPNEYPPAAAGPDTDDDLPF